MEIRELLPNEACKDCQNFILDVKQHSHRMHGFITNFIEVRCKNENTCKLIHEDETDEKSLH